MCKAIAITTRAAHAEPPTSRPGGVQGHTLSRATRQQLPLHVTPTVAAADERFWNVVARPCGEELALFPLRRIGSSHYGIDGKMNEGKAKAAWFAQQEERREREVTHGCFVDRETVEISGEHGLAGILLTQPFPASPARFGL